MPDRLERSLSIVIALCAVVATGTYVRNEFFVSANSTPTGAPGQNRLTPDPNDPRVRALRDSAYFQDWKAELETGISIGPSSAPIQIIEFMDLECPFCARFVTRLDTI